MERDRPIYSDRPLYGIDDRPVTLEEMRTGAKRLLEKARKLEEQERAELSQIEREAV